MKIVLTRSMQPVDIQYIKDGLDKELYSNYEIVIPKSYAEEELCELVKDADVLLGPYITPKIIASANNLKLIQVPWTGMDTFDFEAINGCNIPVCNTHSNSDAVAEIGVALVLDLLKRISYHDRKMRSGNWNRDQRPYGLQSKMVNKQTICMLGYGNIGSRISKILAAFGSTIITVDNNAKEDCLVKEVFNSNQLINAVKKADVIVCTLPLTPDTEGIINKNLFECMKDGTILVNLSRADIVDEDDVWNALKNGKLGAFGSDVWWNPPKRGDSQSFPSKKHEFWKLENVLMSPHRAGFIENSLPHLDGAIDNIISLFKGEELTGIVDVNKGY